jgi:flavin reductase (DIM6/NTAB) family NADH-FMN oxidoreductase RutF
MLSPHPHPAAAPPTDRAFRDALGLFATGVTVVTTRDPLGQPVGVTVNSFNSVSLSPPLVLWSLARRASTLAAFTSASHYAIHVLGAEQRALAERFAGRSSDRWADLAFGSGLGKVPLLEGAVAVFECRQRSRYEEGDHLILVGEVERCSHQDGASPLLFHGGRFYTEHPL